MSRRLGSVKASTSAPGKDDPPRKAKGQTGEIIVRAADLGGDFLDNAFIGMAAIDPETAKWRTIYKGKSIGGGPVSPAGRFIVKKRIGRDVESDQAGIWVYDMTGEMPSRRIFVRQGLPVLGPQRPAARDQHAGRRETHSREVRDLAR